MNEDTTQTLSSIPSAGSVQGNVETNADNNPTGNPAEHVVHTEREVVELVQQNEITPEDNIELPQEEKEIAEVKKNYKLTPKFNKWCELYFSKENKETYLNATQSAIQAYSLDPKEQYGVARSMGSQNLAKLDNVASQIAESKGYTFDKFVDVAWVKMLKSESPEWWDRVGDMVGFRSMKPTTVINAPVQNNTQINVSGEQAKSFNDQFREFVKAS